MVTSGVARAAPAGLSFYGIALGDPENSPLIPFHRLVVTAQSGPEVGIKAAR